MTSLSRLSSQRYDVFATDSSTAPTTFSDIIPSLHGASPLISSCYDVIEKHMASSISYIGTWLSYQFLWDMTLDSISGLIGDDVKNWQ